eukprot:7153214-Prymnesium_polylepis.1
MPVHCAPPYGSIQRPSSENEEQDTPRPKAVCEVFDVTADSAHIDVFYCMRLSPPARPRSVRPSGSARWLRARRSAPAPPPLRLQCLSVAHGSCHTPRRSHIR